MILNRNTTNEIIIASYIFLVLLLLFRVFSNFTLNAPLHFDEAQYWSWSKIIEWGYYSKPPFLAWLINFTNSLCGDEEFCIRLISPFLHSITAVIISYTTFCINKKIRAALFAGFLYILMPGVTFSSFLASTDVPLLFSSSLIGLLVIKIIQDNTKNIFYYVLLGTAISIGILSKYAILYFLISIVISIGFSKRIKNLIINKNFLLCILLSIIIIFPHLLWNWNNSFVTFNHTLDNANLSHLKINLIEPLYFLTSQFIVFGALPLIFIFSKALSYKNLIKLEEIQKLLCFWFLFPIFLIIILAFFSRANANWAVVGFPFGCIFLGTLFKKNSKYMIILSAGSQIFFSLIILILVFSKNQKLNPILKWNFVKQLSAELKTQVVQRDNISFMSDDREDFSHMAYYLRDLDIPMVKWNGDKKVDDHFELTTNTNSLKGLDVIFLTRTKPTPVMVNNCEEVEKLKSMSFLINNKIRYYYIFLFKNWI